MKKSILSILGLLWFINFGMAQSCIPTSLELTSQGQVDSFNINYPNCTEVEGSLYFLGNGDGDIINLDGLSQVTTIGGDLFIQNTTALDNLSGLENLQGIGGDFEIENNENLSSLTPANILNEVGGDIIIKSNAALIDISGFGNLTKVNGRFEIWNNDLLTDLTGVNNIASVESLHFGENELLADLTPFSSLDSIHSRLSYADNPAMINFAGLSSLSYVLTIIVSGGHGLQDFTGLEGITNLEFLDVWDNLDLVDFSGLNNLETVTNGLAIVSNNNLVDFTGLNNLTTVGDLTIVSNPYITNLNGFDNLTSIYNGFSLLYNINLVNVEGLESLEVVNEKFFIRANESLENLSGLESLTAIDSILNIKDNPQLTDLSSIANVPLAGSLDSLSITGNGLLATCGQENICNYVLSGGSATIASNAPGCSDMNELIESCFSFLDNTRLIGNVYTDLDQNCLETAGDGIISNLIVTVENDQYSYGVTADELGNYSLPVLAGDYALNVISPASFWEPCFEDSIMVATAMNDTIQTDLFLTPFGNCPYLDWDVTLPPLRICASRNVVIDYCNYGVLPAEDAIFSVQLDSFLTLNSASLPYTVDADGNILFDLETVDVFECGQIVMSVFLDCDGVALNQIQCIQVDLLSDELCDPNTFWDGSIVKATGYCETDSVFFTLENIGLGNMSESTQFRVDILIDDIVLLHDEDDFQLTSGETRILSYAINDSDGFYLEADQTTGFPVDVEASAVVPNCNDMLNDIILTLFPTEDGDPFSEIFCAPAVNSYDPNIKSASPVGVGPNHEIEKDWELDYTIQFQNTGNDVAYLVVIKDTLSENADLSTLRVKGSSHNFTWALNQGRELVFTFDNINLPDSTSNEPESHGHISYSLEPQSDILPGELIENRAGIYFDFNDPIITNTVFHTIRKPVVANSEYQVICAGTTFQNQLILQDTSIQELTSFLEYDSIHFYHLEVLPQAFSAVDATAEIGTLFEGVLIEGDTSLVLSYTGANGCDSLVTYNISGIVSITEVSEDFAQVRVFPNPVDELLHVVGQENELAQEWRLVNALGQTVWEHELEAYESLDGIVVKGFGTGIYWLEVRTEQGSGIWRVVVE